jgi:beta-lactamase regulating signal transducer with metallopeptidase domain
VVLLKLASPPLIQLSILPNWLVFDRLPTTHMRAVPLDEFSSVFFTQAEISVSRASLAVAASSMDRRFVLIAVSAMGTLVILSRAAAQVGRLRRALRHGAPNDERLNRIANVAGTAMGVALPPPVCVVAANLAPLLWVRWSGPLIVVPRRLADELTEEQLRSIVAHEIAHYLRRDHWTNLLSLFAAALFWWNPIVWWARREVRTAQEACCDALVISCAVASRRKYAETLFQALEFLQSEGSLLPALASGFGSKSSTERRFEMIANPLVNHRLSWWSYPLLLAALAVLPCLPGLIQAQDQSSDLEVIVLDEVLPSDVPVELEEVEGNPLDQYRLRVVVPFEYSAIEIEGSPYSRQIIPGVPSQTDRRLYRGHRSKLGIVVLAFERESGKLAWSSEIELPADGKELAGRQLLLHTGGGVVTTAVWNDDDGLKIQELDAETGKVTAECRLIGLRKEKGSRLPQGQVLETLPGEANRQAEQRSGEPQRPVDQPLIESAVESLRSGGNENDARMQFRTKVIRLSANSDGRLTVELAGTVWRLIHGETPIQSVSMIREGDKDRMVIEGQDENRGLLILEIRAESGDPVPKKGEEAGTPPGSAAAETGAADVDVIAEKAMRNLPQVIGSVR